MRILIAAFFSALLVVYFLFSFVYRNEQLDKRPIILGHGGSGVRSMYPLNSFNSIKQAFELGADGVEIDVRMSLDGELFAINNSRIDDQEYAGSVEALLSQDIKRREVETWFQSSPIQTLEATLQSAVPRGSVVSLDLKTEDAPTPDRLIEFANAVQKILSNTADLNILIESESSALLGLIQQENPSIRLYLHVESADEAMEAARTLKLEGVVLHVSNINDETIRRLKESNLQIMIWGVGDVFDNRKTLQYDGAIVQTDDIRSMTRILD